MVTVWCCESPPCLTSGDRAPAASPKEKLLYSFSSGFPFPLYAEKANCLRLAAAEAWETREGGRGDMLLLSPEAQGAFSYKEQKYEILWMWSHIWP